MPPPLKKRCITKQGIWQDEQCVDDRVHNKRRIHVYAQCCVAAFCPILRVLPHVMTMQRSPLTWRGQAPALQLGLLFLPYHACLLFSFYRACHDRRKTLRCFDWWTHSSVIRRMFVRLFFILQTHVFSANCASWHGLDVCFAIAFSCQGLDVLAASFQFVSTSLLHLDREALPLVLSASLLAPGLTGRFYSSPFRYFCSLSLLCWLALLFPI